MGGRVCHLNIREKSKGKMRRYCHNTVSLSSPPIIPFHDSPRCSLAILFTLAVESCRGRGANEKQEAEFGSKCSAAAETLT